MKARGRRRIGVVFLALGLLGVLGGCKRKPEELEVWRPSQTRNGQDKLTEWVGSSSELMETRVRAAELLIEEDLPYAVPKGLQGATPEDRKAIVEALAQKMGQGCKANDATVENYQANKSLQVRAKEGAFQLYPLAEGSAKQTLEACLLDWLGGGEYHIRDQMGQAKMGQIAELLGPPAAPALIKALEADERNPQSEIARILRNMKDPKVNKEAAQALAKLGKAKLPKIDEDLKVALLECEDEAIVDFLAELVPNAQVDGDLRTTAVDRIQKIKGKAALPVFLRWVKEQPGDLRWMAAQSIAETQGKEGMAPLLNALPDDGKYGTDDPGAFAREAERFCKVEVKEGEVKVTEDFFLAQLGRGSVAARALSIQCLQEVGTSKSRPALEALLEDKTPLDGWGDVKLLGELAKKVLEKLPQ